jgi:hypothetical protein
MPLPSLPERQLLSFVWVILPGLTLPAGGIRSFDGHYY